MKLEIYSIAKTKDTWIKEAIQNYTKSIAHFVNFEFIELSTKKKGNLNKLEIKEAEAQLILPILLKKKHTILLDENAKEYTSIEFSKFISSKVNTSTDICFFIGGAYGFSKSIYNLNLPRISLSKMTITHQMVRVFLLEQVYRSFTIINNLPYHHE